MPVLSQKALEGIASYKYHAGSYTWLDYKMTPFWNASVEYLPMWMAPNLVTFTGTIITAVSTAILGYYSPDLTQEAPAWVYYLCAISIFVYQTLDAIDGKQARRTGSSSPLGQLFDHGCDALGSVLNILGAAAAVGVGPSWTAYVIVACVEISFYLAQWEEYHTGTMTCGNGYFGVTEGQFTLIGIHLFTAMFGIQAWKYQPFSFASVTITECLLVALILSNVCLSGANMKGVFGFTGREPLHRDDQGNKSESKFVAFLQILPILLLFVSGAFWISGPNADDYQRHPVLYLLSIGLASVLLSSRMIVSHMCKIPFSPQLRVLIPLLVLLLNSYLPAFGFGHQVPLLDEFYLALAFAAYITFVYFHFMLHVVWEICDHLHIHLLRLPSKSKDK